MIVHTPGPRTEYGQHCVDCGLELVAQDDAYGEWDERPIVEVQSRLPGVGRRLRSVKTTPKHAKPCLETR